MSLDTWEKFVINLGFEDSLSEEKAQAAIESEAKNRLSCCLLFKPGCLSR